MGHRFSSGMPLRADATCTPHPVQVGSLHTTQVVLKHILLLNALLAAAGRTPSCSPGLAAEVARNASLYRFEHETSRQLASGALTIGFRWFSVVYVTFVVLSTCFTGTIPSKNVSRSSLAQAAPPVAAAAATRARARREVPVVCCVSVSHLLVARAMNGSGARLKAAPERADEDGARRCLRQSSRRYS